MNEKWIQGNINSPMDTRPCKLTPSRHASPGYKVTWKHPPQPTTWESVH